MRSVELGRDSENKPIILDYDEEWSLQDFTNQDLSGADMSGKVIYGSDFSHSVLDSHPFPPSLSGASFYRCNLDNCVVPNGNAIDADSSRRRILSLSDGDFLLDGNNNPTVKL